MAEFLAYLLALFSFSPSASSEPVFTPPPAPNESHMPVAFVPPPAPDFSGADADPVYRDRSWRGRDYR